VLIDVGTPYAVAQLGQDVIVNIGVGNYMLLQNVQLSSLHEGWIVAG
jgi:hypothetical protein